MKNKYYIILIVIIMGILMLVSKLNSEFSNSEVSDSYGGNEIIPVEKRVEPDEVSDGNMTSDVEIADLFMNIFPVMISLTVIIAVFGSLVSIRRF